jgi:hypothetical protein
MKNLTTIVCMVLLTLFAITTKAQNKPITKPSQFAGLPSNIHCTKAQLGNLFAAAKGQNINVRLTDNFTLTGPVTGKITPYHNLQTIIIEMPSFNNSLLSLSKQIDENNNTSYVGRIINPLFSDGFELKQTTTGDYEFIKIDIATILERCDQ